MNHERSDYYELCASLPEGFADAIRELRDPRERQVFLNPIPSAIAGISADEWRAAIDRCEAEIKVTV